MKVLFDHNISEHLKMCLGAHEFLTAKELHWHRLRNGDLLPATEEAGFQVMLTADQNIWYQQNNSARRIVLVVVNTNDLEVLTQFADRIQSSLERATVGSYEFLPLVHRRSSRKAKR